MDMLFTFPGYEGLSENIIKTLGLMKGQIMVRHFPDGESLVQIESDVMGKNIGVVCGLDQPDQKAMSLLFFEKTARELGAGRVGLIAPYLGYMRQDKRFHEGEAVTSNIFASFLSSQFDWLLTIDPHLHRHHDMREIYSIPCIVVHANDLIAEWIQSHVSNPLLIGPDGESEQWVSEVASKAKAPFIILTKTRQGDKDVSVSIPDVSPYKDKTPVLVDDIISTGRTMIQTIAHLRTLEMSPPVCIGVHGVFAEDAYKSLQSAGAARIVTCNTITHPSNEIDVSGFLSAALKDFDLMR